MAVSLWPFHSAHHRYIEVLSHSPAMIQPLLLSFFMTSTGCILFCTVSTCPSHTLLRMCKGSSLSVSEKSESSLNTSSSPHNQGKKLFSLLCSSRARICIIFYALPWLTICKTAIAGWHLPCFSFIPWRQGGSWITVLYFVTAERWWWLGKAIKEWYDVNKLG